MRGDVQKDFKWQMQFVPTIKSLVGPYLLEPAPFEIDAREATDFIVLNARDMRIGCRVRRAGLGFAERYPFEFTIRSYRANGTRTELQKIVDGWGDWFFYGHEGEKLAVAKWWLIDLHAFRAHNIRARDDLCPISKRNLDGSTGFLAYDVRKFLGPPSLVIASSHEFVPEPWEFASPKKAKTQPRQPDLFL